MTHRLSEVENEVRDFCHREIRRKNSRLDTDDVINLMYAKAGDEVYAVGQWCTMARNMMIDHFRRERRYVRLPSKYDIADSSCSMGSDKITCWDIAVECLPELLERYTDEELELIVTPESTAALAEQRNLNRGSVHRKQKDLTRQIGRGLIRTFHSEGHEECAEELRQILNPEEEQSDE